jgi:hypothetical protein
MIPLLWSAMLIDFRQKSTVSYNNFSTVFLEQVAAEF